MKTTTDDPIPIPYPGKRRAHRIQDGRGWMAALGYPVLWTDPIERERNVLCLAHTRFPSDTAQLVCCRAPHPQTRWHVAEVHNGQAVCVWQEEAPDLMSALQRSLQREAPDDPA